MFTINPIFILSTARIFIFVRQLLYLLFVYREKNMFREHHPSFRHMHHRPGFWNRLWSFLTSSTMAFMLAVSAILIGYYQFYLSRPILEYTSSTSKVISSSQQGLQFHINGKVYADLYKSVVTLTNTGEEALSGSNVSPVGHDPIRIPVPPRIKILYYGIDDETTSPAVDAKLEYDDNAVIIKFAYLNPNNRIAVDLYSEQSYNQYKITGSAAGVNQISQTMTPRERRKLITLIALGMIAFYSLFTWLYFRRHRRMPRI